jgi:hypothetical protein
MVISSSTSLLIEASTARIAGAENSGSVASTTSCSASSISPRPISTRPTRPATVDERVMNSTTPTKMNIGESHERSAENSTEISAVPTSAPRITASAAGSVTRPCPTKDEVMSEVAVLDCTSAVTPMPERAAVNRLRMLCTRILRRLAPNTRSTPVRTRWVPHTSSATAASRFRRCFMGVGFCPFRFGSF